MDRHSTIIFRYAGINDVTGDPYAGAPERAEAEVPFDDLKPVQYRQDFRKFAALSRGSYTPISDFKLPLDKRCRTTPA